VPLLVAGGGFHHLRHIAHAGEQNAPLCNPLVTLLQSMGVETDAFGQSTGTPTWT
jgi:hypothetical protein